MKVLLLYTCLFLLVVLELHSQRFPCNGMTLVSKNDGINTSILRDNYLPPFGEPYLSPIAIYRDGLFDGLGFNQVDYYIYAVQANTNAIVRLKMDNTYEVVGIAPVMDQLVSYAGDCSPQGLYMCHDATRHTILVFDVVDEFKFLREIELYWDPGSNVGGAFETIIYDFAIDPDRPHLAYAYQGNFDHPDSKPKETRGSLLQINLGMDDPQVGMVTPAKQIDQNIISHLGGLLFNPSGGLMGYGTAEAGINPLQNNLFSIDRNTGASNLEIRHFLSEFSDGCSCAASFTFTNSVPTEGMYCNGETKTFKLNLFNNSYVGMDDMILRDTLPVGMVAVNVYSSDLDRAIISGEGSDIIEIAGIDIPAKARVEINIDVISIDAPVGLVSNQAFLYNLPERFGGPLGSDELGTNLLIGDASKFIVIPQTLEEATFRVTQASDCIDANDGKIQVVSPQFFPDERYEVKIRNKSTWEETTFEIMIDQENSFTLDSIIPGKYQIFQLRSLEENCSLEIDVDVEVEPPNHILSLDIDSNSPLCENETLFLDGNLSHAGEVRWTGPNRFGSDSLKSKIEDVVADHNGKYMINAEYGYCNRFDTIDIVVHPFIKPEIQGNDTYCVRDEMLLKVTGVGDDLNYIWKMADQTIQDSLLVISSLTSEDTGYYEVIVDNGACKDTVGIDVIVLPTPSLELDKFLEADFCSTVSIQAEVYGDDDVIYKWVPQDGLSCNDCPNPIISPQVQTSYKLIVENSAQCVDSSTIYIVLDRTRLAYTANIFSVGTPGENGRFTLEPSCIVQYVHRLSIYDRWGSVVYEDTSGNPRANQKFWDGNVGSGFVQDGVYTWVAELELVNGDIEKVYGNITVVRAK